MAVTYAFSIHTFIDDIGAYAGFAAAIGLALFALLLFAQARELKRLREWGAHAHDRLADVERRLAGALELARRANAPAARAQATGAAQQPPAVRQLGRQPAASVAARTSAPSKLPLLPAAPAGVGGPALASATVLIPLPKVPPGAALPAAVPAVVPTGKPATPTAQPGTPVARPAAPAGRPAVPAAEPSAAPVPTSRPAAPSTADAPSLTPATAAASAASQAPATEAPMGAPAAGNGHAGVPPSALPKQPPRPAGEDRVPPARPGARPVPSARPGGARPPVRPGQRPVRSSSARPAGAAPLRQRTPSATPRGGGALPPEVPSSRRRVLLALAGGGALVVAIVAVIALSSGGGDDASPTTGASARSTSSTQAQRTTAAAPPHGQTTVAVLNGTPTEGLAATAADQLVADGFVKGTVTNASSQDRPITVVSYYGGHEAEAAEVAKSLGVPSDAVEAIDPDTEAVVCSTGAGTCPETVVVTVGADRQ